MFDKKVMGVSDAASPIRPLLNYPPLEGEGFKRICRLEVDFGFFAIACHSCGISMPRLRRGTREWMKYGTKKNLLPPRGGKVGMGVNAIPAVFLTKQESRRALDSPVSSTGQAQSSPE